MSKKSKMGWTNPGPHVESQGWQCVGELNALLVQAVSTLMLRACAAARVLAGRQ